MFGIFGMLLDGSASPREPTTACRANGILRQNLGQRFGELFIKVCNVAATSHAFIAFPEAKASHYTNFDKQLKTKGP